MLQHGMCRKIGHRSAPHKKHLYFLCKPVILLSNHDLVNLDLILLYLFAKEKSRGSVSKHSFQKFSLIHFIRRHISPDHLLGRGKSH